MKKLISLTAFSLIYLAGCTGELPKKSGDNSPGSSVAALSGDNSLDPNGLDGNGLDGNGLDGNGLDPNGLDGNGLDANGLDPNGLTSTGLTGAQAAAQFNSWFTRHLSQPGANSDKVMKYIAKCAIPGGQTLHVHFAGVVYASPWAPPTCTTNGVDTDCNWPGSLGLAPVWASNQRIPVNEQELISACMAAHVNASGEVINVSFRGGGLLVAPDESLGYNMDEAVFWGNLFNGSGVFMSESRSTFGGYVPRGCAVQGSCDPMVVNPPGAITNKTTPTRFADGSYTTSATARIGTGYVYQAIFTALTGDYAAPRVDSGQGILIVHVSGLPVLNSVGQWVRPSANVDFGTLHYSGLVTAYRPWGQVVTASKYAITPAPITSDGYTYTPTANTYYVAVPAQTVAHVYVTYQ